ncbi:MAG: flagellar basal body P-ring formation chaperone FlgA [Planctomycetota bacterium]
MIARLIGACTLLAALAGIAGADELVLRRTVRVAPGEPVTLADAATLTGDAAEALGPVVLIDSASDRMTLSRRQIREIVEAAGEGVNWGRLSLRGGPTTVIAFERRPRPAIAPAPEVRPEGPTVRSQIDAVLVRFLESAAEDVRIEHAESDQRMLDLAIEGRVVDVRPVGLGERVSVEVTVYEADRIVSRGTVKPRVSVRRAVLDAARNIDRGEVIREDMIRPGERWLSPDRRPVGLASAIGSVARSDIEAGELMESRRLQPEMVVRRGELISVHFVTNGLVVRGTGRAGAEGAIGDRIEIEMTRPGARRGPKVAGRVEGRALVVIRGGDS